MKILVTGGAGFIGSHVVEHLLAKRHRVVVVDTLVTGHRRNLPPGVPLRRLDIRDARKIRAVFLRERPKAVLHLAAQPNVRRSLERPDRDAQVNVLGSVNVLEACGAAGVRRLVFASSGGAVYGPQRRYPCRETDAPRPQSPYGHNKLVFEGIAAREFPGFVALRLANVYGPRQDPKGEAGVVAIFKAALRKNRRPVVFGDGGQTRDYVHVDDAARAFVRAVAAKPGLYNIGTGRETSVNMLLRLLGTREPVRRAAIQGEVRRNVLDVRKARAKLNWSPRIRLEDGINF